MGRERPRVQLECLDATRTQQSFAADCDINNILKKFKRTGELTHLATHNPRYGDFDTDLDYLEASTRVLSAQADFAELSAEIRAKMENDPAKLLAFMADPENIEEMRELGLVLPETAPEPSAMADPPATGGAASEGGETPPPPPPSSSEGV